MRVHSSQEVRTWKEARRTLLKIQRRKVILEKLVQELCVHSFEDIVMSLLCVHLPRTFAKYLTMVSFSG
jgi:hypothetical protein